MVSSPHHAGYVPSRVTEEDRRGVPGGAQLADRLFLSG
jgi:hypothetical protein